MQADNNFSEDNCKLTAQVYFTLNPNGETVVLFVTTDFEALESFMKSRLNYKKVDITKVGEGTIFTLPIRVKA